MIKLLKNAKGSLAIVIDEFGQVSGLVTPLDLFEAIAGEFPDEDESPEIIQQDNYWLVDGTASLDQLRLELDNPNLFIDAEQLTIGGYIGAKLPNLPNINDSIEEDGYNFTIVENFSARVMLVRIEQIVD